MYKSSQTTNNSKNKSQGKLENCLRQMKTKTEHTKLAGKNKSSAKREIYSCKQINKQHINNLNLPSKELEKEGQIKLKFSRRKEKS